MQPGGGGSGAIRVLNVAEKPSVEKAVAEILSRGSMQSRAGRSPYNRVFKFNYSINGHACRMLVTSITGHRMELEFDAPIRRACRRPQVHAPVHKFVPQVCRSPVTPPISSTPPPVRMSVPQVCRSPSPSRSSVSPNTWWARRWPA
jgi:hypothetical protein